MRKSFFLFVVVLLIMSKDGWCRQLPIKPARTIAFTTDEGSYMNIDVSPDGKTLAFDLLGDLYTVPSIGGTATQLTRGLALNLRPVWSPDGKRLAYISDYSGSFHLNVRDITGPFHRVLGQSDEEVSYGQSAIWLPGSNYVTAGKYIYGLVGGKIPLAKKGRLLQYSLNGDIAYYMDGDTLVKYDSTHNSKEVITTINSQSQDGCLSPDARWWAYVIGTKGKLSLILKNLETGIEKITIQSLFRNPYYTPGVPVTRFAFSPDSRFIYIGYGGKIHRIVVGDGHDEVISFQAHVKSDLGPRNYNTFRINQAPSKAKYVRSAQVSPDGRHIVFAVLNKLYIKSLPNGKAHVLIEQSVNQFQPAYSPDGQWIAYVSWTDTTAGQLWRVPAIGGKPEQLTQEPGQYQHPVWSPDGKYIAIVSGKPRLGDRDDIGSGQLLLIPSIGGFGKVLDEDVPLWNQLTFSTDGSRIFYQPQSLKKSDRQANLLLSKDLKGNDQQAVAVGTPHRYLQQISLSPDSNFMIYSGAEDLFLAPMIKSSWPQLIYDKGHQLPIIRFANGVDPYWEQGGKVLCWTYGNHFYKINPFKIVQLAERSIQKKGSTSFTAESDFLTISVKPDTIVDLDVTAPASYAKGTIALRDVRIITMQGNKVINHGSIIIKDGRITAFGKKESTVIPQGAKLLDLPGVTVMPGLVDVHLHMRIPPNIFPQQSWMFLSSLAYGVTTARDPSLNIDSYGYKELLAARQMIGPRLYTVGRAVRPSMLMQFESLNDALSIVQKRASMGGSVVKQYELPSRLKRQWLLMACRGQGLNMTNEGSSDPLLVIAMIKDGSTGVEHNPQWGDVYKDIVLFATGSGTYFTPVLQATYGTQNQAREFFNYTYWRNPSSKMRHFIGSNAGALGMIINSKPGDTLSPDFLVPANIDGRINKQGGHIAMGSHGNDIGVGPHNELWALQMGGLTNLDALKAATITGAEALGIQQDVGSIAVGKIADLLILNKNPLDDIHNSREIRYVMKDGILYDGETLNTIWPVAKKCPEWQLKVK